MSICLAASLLLTSLLGLFISKPLRKLQRASQRIAAGRYEEPMRVDSKIVEVAELANDWEKMRSELVAANRDLRAEVQERVRAEQARLDMERKLRHVQKLETIGTLAGGVAHELNNVLQPIRLYTELAMGSLPSDNLAKQDLERVLRLVARAKTIVEQILAFSRVSHKESFELIDVGHVVRDAMALARAIFPASVAVRYEISTLLPTVLGDENQLHQLIMNLCSNAYLSLPASGGSILTKVSQTTLPVSDIDFGDELEAGNYVRIEVADTGHGMDPVTLERIFEPFFTTRGPGKGTGLGLSVAHGIAKAHGGAIGARSELGAGTVITVVLPSAEIGSVHRVAEQKRTGRGLEYIER